MCFSYVCVRYICLAPVFNITRPSGCQPGEGKIEASRVSPAWALNNERLLPSEKWRGVQLASPAEWSLVIFRWMCKINIPRSKAGEAATCSTQHCWWDPTLTPSLKDHHLFSLSICPLSFSLSFPLFHFCSFFSSWASLYLSLTLSLSLSLSLSHTRTHTYLSLS